MDLSSADFDRFNLLIISNKMLAEVENGRAYYRQDNGYKSQDWKS